MTKGIYKIADNHKIAKDIYKMVLIGDTSAVNAPGQFINIALNGFYLRRPISICDYDNKSITIIYKSVGEGTEYMSTLQAGNNLDVLVGLGNGFNTSLSGNTPLVIGGGVGIPPMYNLTKKLISEGKNPIVILGFNTKDDSFYIEDFEKLGIKTLVATTDGSIGKKGFVTSIIAGIDDYSYFYTCGPILMLKAIYDNTSTSGQLSFEERMACGFGACMGCSCKTKYGDKRICKDGPVLVKEEIIW